MDMELSAKFHGTIHTHLIVLHGKVNAVSKCASFHRGLDRDSYSYSREIPSKSTEGNSEVQSSRAPCSHWPKQGGLKLRVQNPRGKSKLREV